MSLWLSPIHVRWQKFDKFYTFYTQTCRIVGHYDATTPGDTKQSKDRFITEVYDEVKDFPPVVDGKRTMPRR